MFRALGALGIVVPPGSRLEKYRSVAVEAQGVAPGSIYERLPVLHQSVLEVDVFSDILRSLPRGPTRLSWIPRLQEALSGHELPRFENGHKGWSTEFELRLAALAAEAGYAVAFVEPDLRIRRGAHSFHVAAKRVRSVKKIETRIREAARQLSGTGDGVVALDLSPLFDKGQEPFQVGERKQAVIIAQQAASLLGSSFANRRRGALLDHPNVLALIVWVSVRYLANASIGVAGGLFTNHLTLDLDARRHLSTDLVAALQGNRGAVPPEVLSG